MVLLVGWPLNSYATRRSIRISKGVLAARDKRMGVLSELIGAVCAFLVQDCILLIFVVMITYIRCYDRSNSLNFLLGKNDGSTEQWMLDKMR